jgi:predicted TPR repeat methyltransferase
VPEAVNAHLQRGVAAYYDDRPAADGHFRAALAADPGCLVPWFCLTKIHTYQGHLAEAEAAARSGLAAAAAQGGFAADWAAIEADAAWTEALARPESVPRFLAYMLKALAFVRLKAADLEGAETLLGHLARLDPEDRVGHGVIRALAGRLRESASAPD